MKTTLRKTGLAFAIAAVTVLMLTGMPAPQAEAADDVICSAATPCGGTAELINVPLEQLSPAEVAALGEHDQEAAASPSNGFGLAWAVMAILGLSLIYALAAAAFTALGRGFPALQSAGGALFPVLAVIGLGVALYLTYVETQNVAAVCGPVGDCNSVQSSPYAKLFGILPVGLLGAAGYVAVLGAWILVRRQTALARPASLVLFAMALFGVLFSVYLTYLELYIIHAVCIWCLTSAVIMSLVLVLSVGPALQAFESDGDE